MDFFHCTIYLIFNAQLLLFTTERNAHFENRVNINTHIKVTTWYGTKDARKKQFFLIHAWCNIALLCGHAESSISPHMHNREKTAFVVSLHGAHTMNGVLMHTFLSVIKLVKYEWCMGMVSQVSLGIPHIIFTWHCIVLGIGYQSL